jgi:antitoxin VapB
MLSVWAIELFSPCPRFPANPWPSAACAFSQPGTDAIMRKEGDRLILEPAPKHSIDRLLAVLGTLEDLPEDEQLPEIEDLPPEPFNL